ncbi:YdcF family protein [Candidatus Uhrbacteria bacterium]|nr:YdcF family protein [Candidatus Uhrbacteria bacterium]
MRQPIFLICGYGVPKDIHTDINYQTYLHLAFNTMFRACPGKPCDIVVCGGPTNIETPYTQTEAAVMSAHLEELKARPAMRGQADTWNISLEDTSLSSLENLLFASQLMQYKGLEGQVTIFCELSRAERIAQTGKEIFKEVHVEPIDFDITQNRYLDPAIIQKKEAAALQDALWTLQNPERLPAHHLFFEKKMEWFRAQHAQDVPLTDIVREWHTTKLYELARELMPDHPLLTRT